MSAADRAGAAAALDGRGCCARLGLDGRGAGDRGAAALADGVLPDPVPRRGQDLPQRGGVAQPPYRRCSNGTASGRSLTLNFGNFAYLWSDPLYVNAYLFSIRVAFISTVLALLVGYPMAYFIARSPEPRRSCS